mmetsp:Transcript_16354/g.27633  ORF Transcript_16354/g.27633 Transcript_16354/m.27633 type:complete len:287 (-) Transcript_16354:2125-2985(-)
MSFSHDLWCGRIAIELSLADEDATSLDAPHPVHLLCSRFAYLPAVAANAVREFQQHAIDFSPDVWFEADGSPLKSNLPIGVLSDILRKEDNELPWKIRVHFQNFPSQQIMKCTDPTSMEKVYFHSLKQGLFLLHGNTHLFNDLSVTMQNHLWLGIQQGCRSDSYAEIIDGKFKRDCSAENVRCIPIRVFTRERPMMQRPVAALRSKAPLSNKDADVNEEEASSNIRTLQDVLVEDFGFLSPKGDTSCDNHSIQVTCHGVVVPFESPILDLWKVMSYSDLFLYLWVA